MKNFKIAQDKRGGVVFKLEEVGLYSSWDFIVSKFFLTGVVLGFEWCKVLFVSGVAFNRIR